MFLLFYRFLPVSLSFTFSFSALCDSMFCPAALEHPRLKPYSHTMLPFHIASLSVACRVNNVQSLNLYNICFYSLLFFIPSYFNLFSTAAFFIIMLYFLLTFVTRQKKLLDITPCFAFSFGTKKDSCHFLHL